MKILNESAANHKVERAPGQHKKPFQSAYIGSIKNGCLKMRVNKINDL